MCEDTGVVSIFVLVLMNSLARDVVVTLTTIDDTASGEFDNAKLAKITINYLPISSCMQLGWITQICLEASHLMLLLPLKW